MWPNQARISGVPTLPIMTHWVNIKVAFRAVTGKKAGGMMFMLRKLSIKHEGRQHSGIDDCWNIARLCLYFHRKNYEFIPSGFSQESLLSKEKFAKYSLEIQYFI
jgi:inhibitor of KinA sporulation pathway (predicted exonuclease)